MLVRWVIDEFVDLSGRRRQSDQIEIKSTNQNTRLGIGGRLQPASFESLQNETVDLSRGPTSVCWRGDLRAFDQLEGPELARFVKIDVLSNGRRLAFSRIGGPHFDPLFEISHDTGGKLLLRRHFQTFILDGLNQQALVDVSWYDGMTAFTSTSNAFARVEQQTCFHRLGLSRMARITLFHQDRPDLLFEEFKLLR